VANEIVITQDPALFKAVLMEHYPDVVDRQVAIKELVYLGKLKQEDMRRPGPRTEPREAVRQAKEVGLTWRRAVEEGRTGSWSAQHDLPIVLGFAEKLLGGAPSGTAKVLSTVAGLAQDAMSLTPVQDWFTLESTVESSRWQRQLTISDLSLDDDIYFITDSCLSDQLCATESTYVARSWQAIAPRCQRRRPRSSSSTARSSDQRSARRLAPTAPWSSTRRS